MSNDATKLNELKEYATEIGVEFRDNIGIPRLEEKIKQKEEELAKEREKAKRKEGSKIEKIEIIVEPRNRQEGVYDQFFSYSSMKTGHEESILVMFGEPVKVSTIMYDYIKSIKYIDKKPRMTKDEYGNPKQEIVERELTRFIVSKV